MKSQSLFSGKKIRKMSSLCHLLNLPEIGKGYNYDVIQIYKQGTGADTVFDLNAAPYA